jgi:hypothetical protein
MKRYNYLFLFLFFILSACGGKKKQDAAESDIDAARNFIQSALEGKFNEARKFMLSDSANNYYMDIAYQSYQNVDRDTKTGYASASINIHQITHPDDTTTIVIYSNSFKKERNALRVIKQKNGWLVDLSYLYEHKVDSNLIRPLFKDSLPK